MLPAPCQSSSPNPRESLQAAPRSSEPPVSQPKATLVTCLPHGLTFHTVLGRLGELCPAQEPPPGFRLSWLGRGESHTCQNLAGAPRPGLSVDSSQGQVC